MRGKMQRGSVRWQRGRTEPEPSPWGCSTSKLSGNPRSQPHARWERARGRVATLSPGLSSHPLYSNRYPIWGPGMGTHNHVLKFEQALKAFLLRWSRRMCSLVSASPGAFSRGQFSKLGLTQGPFSQTWRGHPGVPKLLHIPLQIQTKPIVPGNDHPPQHRPRPGIEQSSRSLQQVCVVPVRL